MHIKVISRLLQRKIIDKEAYLTICDFSQSSTNKRIYIVDIANCRLLAEYLCGTWSKFRRGICKAVFQQAQITAKQSWFLYYQRHLLWRTWLIAKDGRSGKRI